MKYFVDADGRYLGGWDMGGPDGALEVPFPPDDARQVWDGDKWGGIVLSSSERRAGLLSELTAVDAASARPLRAILVGSATDEDRARLTELDEQAAALRVELAALESPQAA